MSYGNTQSRSGTLSSRVVNPKRQPNKREDPLKGTGKSRLSDNYPRVESRNVKHDRMAPVPNYQGPPRGYVANDRVGLTRVTDVSANKNRKLSPRTVSGPVGTQVPSSRRGRGGD